MYEDPLCRSEGASHHFPRSDITYNHETSSWSCYGYNASAYVDCIIPVLDTSFSAYPPDFPGPDGQRPFLTQKTSPQTGSPTGTNTTLGTPSRTFSSTTAGIHGSKISSAASSISTSKALGDGASAGIGVGAAAISIVGFTVVVFYIKPRRTRQTNGDSIPLHHPSARALAMLLRRMMLTMTRLRDRMSYMALNNLGGSSCPIVKNGKSCLDVMPGRSFVESC